MAPRKNLPACTLLVFGLWLCSSWNDVVVVNASETRRTRKTSLRRRRHRRRHSRTLLQDLRCLRPWSGCPDDEEEEEFLQDPRQFRLLSSQEIRDDLLQWAEYYPSFMKLTTSQEKYGLPAAGTAQDCTFDADVKGCLNYIVSLQDFVTHPEGSYSSNRLPEVLLSGEVHGDERVGPTAVMETTVLLLQAAACIQYPRLEVKSNPEEWQKDLEFAAACRQEALDVYGVDESQLRWLARLVSTRRIVIVPTANALGYDRKVRAEGDLDPNRDFAYEQDPALCMRTIAGRTLNEVVREHMFQLSLTFHGGVEMIGYEWGNISKLNTPFSPDNVAQDRIAAAYSQYGGSWSQSPQYEYAPMNEIIYPVYGGMEDWLYAGSWEPEYAVQCKPQTFGGYPIEKTIYDDSTLRAFNMLIETSSAKTPGTLSLGSSADIMDPSDTENNGHVTRNVRLSLLAIELVQPWLSFGQVNGLALTDDIIPSQANRGPRRNCQSTKRVRVSSGDSSIGNVDVEWKVGGALHVDETTVFYAKWDDIPADALDCLNQPSFEQLQGIMIEGGSLSKRSGHTEFAASVADGEESYADANSSTFTASIDLSMFQPNDEIVVLAMARVDQDWSTIERNAVPQLSPQSHIANARTNSDWHHETSDGKVIQGRLDWFSEPLTIEIGDGTQVETVELSNRGL